MAPLFEKASFTPSLKDSKLWSLDFIRDAGVEGPFNYIICQKVEGGYDLLGEFATATEAFAARRELVASTGTTSYFIRAVRVSPVAPVADDTGEALDLFRDALRSGDESLIPPHQLAEYRSWAAKTVASRPVYRAF